MSIKLVTPPGRVSFPNLFVPVTMKGKDGKPSGDPKFSITLLLPKDDDAVKLWIAELRSKALAVVTEKWPNEDKRPKQLKRFYKDGDTLTFDTGELSGQLKSEKYPEMAGHYVINASTKQRPHVVDASLNPILDEVDFYPGCWARISFNIYAYNNVNVGVGAGLLNVQKVKDGEPFGSGSRPEDDFTPVAAPATGGKAVPAVDDLL